MGPLKHPLQTAEDQALDREARRRLQRRIAQAKYTRTAKGKAAMARYNQSAKKRAANARYLATAGGQQANAICNERRIFVGQNYRGRAETTEQASVIRSHVKERLRAFERQQTRTQAEGAEASAVSSEAIARAD